MNASAVTRFLQHVPPLYPIVVVQNGKEVLIESLEYSHLPAQVTLKLAAPAPTLPGDAPTDEEMRAAFGDASPTPEIRQRRMIVELAKRWPGHAGVDFETTATEDLLKLIADAVPSNQQYTGRLFVALEALLDQVDKRCGGRAEGDTELVEACDEARALTKTRSVMCGTEVASLAAEPISVASVIFNAFLDDQTAKTDEAMMKALGDDAVLPVVEAKPKPRRRKATPPAAPETT